MKLIVRDVNYRDNIFYCYVDGKRVGFYLTNKFSQTFMNYIEVGFLVDFKVTNKTKLVNGYKAYQINHFNLIKNLRTNKYIYNHYELQAAMINFLDSNDYYLFLDLEMTMAKFRQKNFKAEILQYGYVLVGRDIKTISENGNYLKTKSKHLNKRIFRFLNISEDEYFQQAINPQIFYDELKDILNNYNPKIVVWGKNDIKALNDFYKLHKVSALTNSNNFVDLLRLHKNFFNLKNDLGLFNAYKEYYLEDPIQAHDAIEDAKVTKAVFSAFKKYAKHLNSLK